MDNLNIKVETTDGVLTILQGKTLTPKDPLAIKIEGNIKAVSDFLAIRKTNGFGFQNIDAAKAIVLVDKKDGQITLLTDPQNEFGATIKGSLEEADELQPFCINKTVTFKKDELIKIIKFNKLNFDDAVKHGELLKAYQTLEVTANLNLKDAKDDRGNKSTSFDKTVTTNIPTEFVLNVPIFKGFESQRFRVEICLDATDGGARFWFESVELNEIMITQKEIIINEELKSATGLVVINS